MRDVYFDGCGDAGPWDEARNCYVEFPSHMAWKGYQAATKAEREACAKVCDDLAEEERLWGCTKEESVHQLAAAAIRARGDG